MRKALVIGNDYVGTKDQLYGCVNDAIAVASMLRKLGYQVEVKTEQTRQAMLNAMTELVSGSSVGDKLYFHYSGHGTQVMADGGSEPDQKDEVIVPTDYNSAGYIRDNDLRKILIDSLPPGVSLIATVDACHSGTVFDLNWTLFPSRPLSSLSYRESSGEILTISACQDGQEAGETGGRGLFTTDYLSVLEGSGYKITPNALIEELGRRISGQTPQMSFSYPPRIVSNIPF